MQEISNRNFLDNEEFKLYDFITYTISGKGKSTL